MYFENLQDILQMAGHGVYVWSAYAISLAVLVGLIAWPVNRYRRQLRWLKRRAVIESGTNNSSSEGH